MQCTGVFLTLTHTTRQLGTAPCTVLSRTHPVTQLGTQYAVPDLLQLLAVQLPLVRQHQTVQVAPYVSPHPAEKEIMELLQVVFNTIARILQWSSGEVFYIALERHNFVSVSNKKEAVV